MRFIWVCILFFISFLVQGQNTYVFDYCMIYEYKPNEDSLSLSKRFIYVNSQKPGYLLTIHYDLKKESSQVILYDMNNDTHFIYTTEQPVPIDSVSIGALFANPIQSRFSFSEKRKKAQNKYEVSYEERDGGNEIILKAYKNPKKKKLVSVHHFTMQSHPELKNQFYINPALAFAYKFDITQVQTQDLVAESYFIRPESDLKEQIWKLIDVKKVDFEIQTPID